MTTAWMLIVEDERLVAQALRRRVAALGHTVVGLAASGEDRHRRGPASPDHRPAEDVDT